MSDKSSIERERYTQSLIEKWRNDYDAKEGEQIEKANAAKIEPSSGLNVSSPKQMRPKEQADSKDIESTDLDVDIDEDLNFVISKLSTPAGTLRGSSKNPSQIKFGGDLSESIYARNNQKENIAAKLQPPNEQHPSEATSEATNSPTGGLSEKLQTMSTKQANQCKKQKINVYIYPWDQPHVIPLHKIKTYTHFMDAVKTIGQSQGNVYATKDLMLYGVCDQSGSKIHSTWWNDIVEDGGSYIIGPQATLWMSQIQKKISGKEIDPPMTMGQNPYGPPALPFIPSNPFQQAFQQGFQQDTYPFRNMATSKIFPTTPSPFLFPRSDGGSPNLNVHARPFEVPTIPRRDVTLPSREKLTSTPTSNAPNNTETPYLKSTHSMSGKDVTGNAQRRKTPPHLRALRTPLQSASKDKETIMVKLFRGHDLSINSTLMRKTKLDTAFTIKEVITALGGDPREEDVVHLKAEMGREGITFKFHKSYQQTNKQTVKDLGWKEGECFTLYRKGF